MDRDSFYIEAIYSSKQEAIAEAYKAMKQPFIAFVRSHCTMLQPFYSEDVYHEAFIRMQQNILQGKLTPNNLDGTLSGYLKGIGFNVAMEMVRKQREMVVGDEAWEAMLNSLEQQAGKDGDEGKYSTNALWIMEVEERFTAWCRTHPKASKEERKEMFDSLTDTFLDHHRSRSNTILADNYVATANAMDDVLSQERDKVLRGCVEQMKAPCAPLLLGAIWEEKSNLELTIELGYANEDSTKNQKSKCLKKLKSFIKPLLKQYGYDYQ